MFEELDVHMAANWLFYRPRKMFYKIQVLCNRQTSLNIKFRSGEISLMKSLFYFLGFFYGFIDRTAEDMTGNRERERGSDTQQRDQGWKSNPGPLQSLGTWAARSTHWAKRHPKSLFLTSESMSLYVNCLLSYISVCLLMIIMFCLVLISIAHQ